MHPLPQAPPSTPWRTAQIVSREELNRARSIRTLAANPGAPDEAHPWAYVFPRPRPVGAVRQITSQRP